MNAPSWSGPKASRLWSARGDERCSPPRSDDYKDWSLMQLKREITQRQLKTNPRKRNKDAFVKVLLSNDQEQTQTHKQQTLEDAVMFAPTSTSELQNMYANNGDQQQQQNLYAGQQQQDIYNVDHHQQQQQQQIFANEMDMEAMQTSNLTPTASTRPRVAQAQIQAQVQSQARSQSQVQGQVETQVQAPVSVAAIAAPVSVAEESEVDTPNSFQVAKRQKMEETRQERRGSENESGNVATEVATKATATQQHAGKGSTEYLRRKLGIQAARLEIDGRRLELETKREQRSSELHAVQLALAQEQLKQAKMTTQKMKTDWMVEQLIQKKRLNDAGISQEDTATLGMYLS
ncbi:uncharacterized protein KRP23_8744 [Phytophthora ramorum]|uniref:uncharacterized protein n=1 Tax=Phytophthora ramorum TaxID=164328 RepID=UPI0030B6EF73|nr:hypothetical protein KRP23_8744 [Phytophthora ramorum]